MDIQVNDLTYRYDDRQRAATTPPALDGVTFSIPSGRITGVLGRNGSGKTTLLSVLGNFLRATSGEVLVDDRPVFEDPVTAAATCLIRDEADVVTSDTARDAFELAAALRPSFDLDRAHAILAAFGVPADETIDELSTGQASAVRIALGLASRAPLTMLDEVHLGLDAPSRYRFYDLVLEEYELAPRTILLSTHLIEEAGQLFEDVLIIDRGRTLLHEPVDDLRARGATVTGPSEVVDRFVTDLDVVDEQQLGPTKRTTTIGVLDDARRREANELGLELGGVPLQDVFVHLTARPDDRGRGTDDGATTDHATEEIHR